MKEGETMTDLERITILERVKDITAIIKDLSDSGTRFDEVTEVVKLAILSDIASKLNSIDGRLDMIETRLDDIACALDE